MTQQAQVSILSLVCGTVLVLGGVVGIFCQGPFWASGVVAAMNPDENALALGLPAGVSLAGALLLSYVILASPLTAHWPPRKRVVVFVVFGSFVLVACGLAAWFAGHVVSRKLQITEAPSNQPLDPTALSLRVCHMITIPASLASPELALGRRAVAQWGRSLSCTRTRAGITGHTTPRMDTLISIFLFFAFVGGVVSIVALWTQYDIDRAGKRDVLAKDKSDEVTAQPSTRSNSP
jgi:hypothetical protein